MPARPFEIPVRTMTSSLVRNLVVTGRAISATREANGAIRHQATAMALKLAICRRTPSADTPFLISSS
jgi:hypothetical protein